MGRIRTHTTKRQLSTHTHTHTPCYTTVLDTHQDTQQYSTHTVGFTTVLNTYQAAQHNSLTLQATLHETAPDTQHLHYYGLKHNQTSAVVFPSE